MIWGSCNTSAYMLCADEKYLTMATGCCDGRPEQQDPHEDLAKVDVGQEDHQALVHVARSCSSPRLALMKNTSAFVANNTRMLHN